MPLSRIALAAAAAAFAAQAAAQPGPAPVAAADAQREEVREAIFGCGGTTPDEIVVCGRRGVEDSESQRYRVPSAAYSGPRDSAGDAQRQAMEANTDLCSPVGTVQRCSGGVDILGVLFGAVRIVQAVRARRD